MTDDRTEPQPRLWTLEGFRDDEWRHVADAGELDGEGCFILPFAAWRELDVATREKFAGRLGVLLAPGEPLAGIEAELDRLPLVALAFPAFNDGRSFSKAELLRRRHGYQGDIRATGEVLIDLLPHMIRTGFTSFEVSDRTAIRRLEQGRTGGLPLHYQPATRPAAAAARLFVEAGLPPDAQSAGQTGGAALPSPARRVFLSRGRSMTAFDYVIVGGGSAGCVLAARLSEDPAVSVCLIEAGGEGRDLLVRMPAGIVAMVSGRGRINNWAYRTVPQPHLNGRRGFQPRGRALGGSSAINAMLYTRGHPRDYDEWAELGCDGWSWEDVLPWFRRSEGNSRGADHFHGGDGPLQVRDQCDPRPASRAFVEACAEMQIPLNDDFNGPGQEGAGLYQVTQTWRGGRPGERCSAAAAYLHPVMDRPNLSVVTRALATKIVFADKRATGVRYIKGGREHLAEARREVIVSGGAFNSPQLLMLSGIGPADELERHGIDIVHELPGVGQNLQDHPDFTAYWRSRDTDLFGLGLGATASLLKHYLKWRRDGGGLISTPAAEGGAFVRSRPDLDRPDLQLHFVIGMVENHARRLRWGYGFGCHVCVLRPHSRGQVTLADANPRTPPAIDPAYLSDPRDADLLLSGVRLVRRIMAAPALAKFRDRELHISGEPDDAELLSHIRARADTIYHPVGTCRMGRDDMAVVDPALKVRGVEGLRVVDASVMPLLIGGNTNAPTIMIAERAAHFIRAAG